MSDSENTSVCRIGDPYLAAHLYAQQYGLIEVDRGAESRSKFSFKGEAEKEVDNYYNDEETLFSAKDLFNAFKTIRSVSTQIIILPDGYLGVRDIYFATYLRHKGYKTIRIERLPFQSMFIFYNIPEEIILFFYNGTKELLRGRKLFEDFKSMRNLSSRVSRED